MPPRGASGAPSFDPIADSRSIIGFFEDLDFCLEQAGINDDAEKKGHAVRYVPDLEKTIWRAFPEYADDDSTYEDFKR
ncbi:hypothetical protein GSI_13271 [Ganoderma sinense ZZ0214-1]|uniref:Uncharacterized protein n=1 Tax=Ganoderma sinense ZZ0214-1 TaxID=1077348 RepID=A0A2G8RV49_9APHY|nr:hypothetical protein GSI_13271 [Ganoderma sinense ZZ0214-1]